MEKTQEDILKDERARVEEIDAISARFTGRVTKIDELRTQAVKEGWTPELFKGNIADRITDGKAIETPSSELGLSTKEMRQFSVLRLMNSMVPGAGSEAIKAAAFERECSAVVSAELSKSMPDFSPKGMLIPFEVQSASTTSRNIYGHPEYRQFFPRTGRRDMSVGDATHGANLVGTNLLASEFAPMLRDRLVTAQLGVRTLSGLVGNVSFPRQTGASTAYWPGEATNITAESNPVVGTVAMAPNEVGAYVDVSNRLLVQSTPGAEGLVRNDIMSQVAIAIDLAFFEGTGGVQPTGIESTTGVGTVNAAGLGWAELVEFETDVAAANADIGAMSYVVDAAGRGILKTREKSTGYPLFLMGDDGQANGYPVVATNFLTTGHMHFGVFSQGIIGEWGVMQLTVDPYGQAIGGITRFVVLHMVDVGIRQPAAFSFATNLS